MWRSAPTGHRLATGGEDDTVRLWNADTGQPIGEPAHRPHGPGIWCRVQPRRPAVASAGRDDTVRLWPVAATPQMLCNKLTANMSHKQWRDWVSSDIGYITLCPGLPIPADGATGQN